MRGIKNITSFTSCLLFLITSISWSGYLESRHWGTIAAGVGDQDIVAGHWALERYQRLNTEEPSKPLVRLSWSSRFESEKRIQPGFALETQRRTDSIEPSAASIFWALPTSKFLQFELSVDAGESSSRLMEAPLGGRAKAFFHERLSAPLISLGLWGSSPLALVRDNGRSLWLGLRLSHRQGKRRMTLDTTDANGDPAWALEEDLALSGTNIEFSGNAPIAGDWIWNATISPPWDIESADHALIYKSTQSAYGSGMLTMPKIFVMPPSASMGLALLEHEKSFWIRLRWIGYSQLLVGGGTVDQTGAGTIWDTNLVRNAVLGRGFVDRPHYQDSMGLELGSAGKLIPLMEFVWGAQLLTQYAHPGVLEPSISAGISYRLGPKTRADIGLHYNRKDYHGDGLLHPTNTLLDDRSLALTIILSLSL